MQPLAASSRAYLSMALIIPTFKNFISQQPQITLHEAVVNDQLPQTCSKCYPTSDNINMHGTLSLMAVYVGLGEFSTRYKCQHNNDFM